MLIYLARAAGRETAPFPKRKKGEKKQEVGVDHVQTTNLTVDTATQKKEMCPMSRRDAVPRE